MQRHARRMFGSICVSSPVHPFATALRCASSSSASPVVVPAPSASSRPQHPTKPSYVFFEIWEHFRRFHPTGSSVDATSFRILCTPEVATAINDHIPMRHVLETFLVPCSGNSASAGVSGVGEGGGAGGMNVAPHIERGWYSGMFGRTAKPTNRCTILEFLQREGWTVTSVSTCLSEREWLITTSVLSKG